MWQTTDQNTVVDGSTTIEIFLRLGDLLQSGIGDLEEAIRTRCPQRAVAF